MISPPRRSLELLSRAEWHRNTLPLYIALTVSGHI
jgi:hypothetical protein